MDYPLRPLRTATDYEAALKAYERFFDREPEPGTPDGDVFELLGMLIAKYEDERLPIGPADPVETLRLVMESRGYTRADLGRVLGSSARATEVMERRRELTLHHIRKLRAAWRVPTDALIGRAA